MSDDMRARTITAEADRLRYGGSTNDPEVRDAAYRRYGVTLGNSSETATPPFTFPTPDYAAGAGEISWFGALILPVILIVLVGLGYGGWLVWSHVTAPAPPRPMVCSGSDAGHCKTVGAVYAVVRSEMMVIGGVMAWLSGGVPSWMASIDEANERANGEAWRDWRKAVLAAREKMAAPEPTTAEAKLAILRPLQAAYARLFKGYWHDGRKDERFERLGRDRALYDRTINPGGPVQLNAVRLDALERR